MFQKLLWVVLMSAGIATVVLAVTVSNRSEFFLKSRATGKCVDVEGGPGVADGSRIHLWDCEVRDRARTDQLWYRGPDGSLRNIQSDKCLDVNPTNSRAPGAPLQLTRCTGAASQRWNLEFLPGSVFARLENQASGLCLDVEGMAENERGVIILQWPCEDFCYTNGDGLPTDHWWELHGPW